MADATSGTDAVVVAQPVSAPLTRAAIFLVVTINRARTRAPCGRSAGTSRAWFGRLNFATSSRTLLRHGDRLRRLGPAVRGTEPGRTSPVSRVPCRIAPRDRNAGRPVVPYPRQADGPVLRDGDADHGGLGDAVTAVDEVHGFRYFDDRDLLGFVDGTENPRGQAVIDAALIGAEDAAFAGGSYVITQKYLHDLAAWNALPTETQEQSSAG